jgi:hypothetical protein
VFEAGDSCRVKVVGTQPTALVPGGREGGREGGKVGRREGRRARGRVGRKERRRERQKCSIAKLMHIQSSLLFGLRSPRGNGRRGR